MSYLKRKAARIIDFYVCQYRYCKVKCMACNGSGKYDNINSSKCSGCEGTGFGTKQHNPLIEQLLIQELSSQYFDKQDYNGVLLVSKLLHKYHLMTDFHYKYSELTYASEYTALINKISNLIEHKLREGRLII